MKKQTGQSRGLWIGLHRKADNEFYWIDGTPLDGEYSAWAKGEPNNLDEKCVHIFKKLQGEAGKWNDVRCSLSETDPSLAPVAFCQKKSI